MKYFILLSLFLFRAEAEQTQSCDSQIYCQGPLLHTIQMARLYNDSKPFVDMSLIHSPEETLEKFNTLMKDKNNQPSKEDLRQFIKDNFESNGELVDWKPSDLNENPKLLERIADTKVKAFAKSLINIWPKLGKKVDSAVFEHPERHSIIPIPNGFIIPGGRFKEVYYWDTYWIIKGLLLSDMSETVRGILENFLFLISKYGFIPNGTRVYYLNRSQPPLFTHMVAAYMDVTHNNTWLEKHVDTIESELNWWWDNRRLKVNKLPKEYDMFRYAVKSDTARPESYYQDTETCDAMEESKKNSCYINLKSGAESGWDYSSRWLFTNDRRPSNNLSMIDITHVVPVDLNAFLCQAFGEVGGFYELLNNVEKASFWYTRQNKLKKAIKDVLYNEEDGIWYDFDLIANVQRKGFYPSNFVPLWADAYNLERKSHYGIKATNYFKQNRIGRYLGGVPTSLYRTGQQWDLPNAWPPLQDFIVSGLKRTGVRKAERLAASQAKIALEAFMKGFEDTHDMFEKYDAYTPGQYGGGGEYIVQSGFGWTNGGALHFIDQFYTKPDVLAA